MDLGLYHLKYPFRKVIGFLLPLFKNVHPNTISWSLVPIGLVTALFYLLAPQAPVLYLIGALLILVRMTVGTMDGLVAVKFNKGSKKGEMINRIAPEICDVLLMLAVVYSCPAHLKMGILALGLCWMVTFFGLIGIVAEKKIQSVGPVGQTDRIVALGILSIFQFFSQTGGWGIDFTFLFFLWVIGGSLVTIGLRAYRNLKGS